MKHSSDSQERKHIVSESSINALKERHSRKRAITTGKLNAAILRMAADNTEVIKSGFKWTKQALANEAGIHLNTLFSRREGKLVYQGPIDSFEIHRSRKDGKAKDAQVGILAQKREEMNEVIKERDMLLERLKEADMRIIEERDRALEAIKDSEDAKKRLTAAGLLMRA